MYMDQWEGWGLTRCCTSLVDLDPRHRCGVTRCYSVAPSKRVSKRQNLPQGASIKQRPFTQYAFDLIVLSEADSKGNRFILTVVDSFSGAVELFALSHADVISVADCLHDVLSRWSRPHAVRSDNAKSFAAAAVRDLTKEVTLSLKTVKS